jgi:poly(beta-D-mannuronate) lyase
MEYNTSFDKINSALSKVKPGDKIILEDGTINNLSININTKGQLLNRITIKPKNPGKLILTGKISITISGSYTTLANLVLKDGGNENAITIRGNGNRLTGCDISLDNTNGPIIMVYPKNNRIDHCYIHDFTKEDRWIQKDPGSKSEDYILIDHNIIKNRKKGSKGNGYETIQLRNEENSIKSKSIIYQNMFEKCDGEIEMISIKSSDNIIANNTTISSKATITLRSGNNNYIVNNKFLQNNTDNSGGLRITGKNHTIKSNLFKEINGGDSTNCAICIINKESYQQVKNLKVSNNIFINNDYDIVLGSGGGNVTPTDIYFNDNIVYKTSKNPVFSKKGGECKNLVFTDNKYYVSNIGKSPINFGSVESPSKFNVSIIDENKYGVTEKYGTQWNVEPETLDLNVEIQEYYERLKSLFNVVDPFEYVDPDPVDPIIEITIPEVVNKNAIYKLNTNLTSEQIKNIIESNLI